MTQTALPDGLAKNDDRSVSNQVFDEMAQLARSVPTPGLDAMRHAASTASDADARHAVNTVFGNIDFSTTPELLNLQKQSADESKPVKPPKPPKPPKPKKPKAENKPGEGIAGAADAVKNVVKRIKKRQQQAVNAFDSLKSQDPFFEIEVEAGLNKKSSWELAKEARHALDRAKERIDDGIQMLDIDRIENLAREKERPRGDFHIALTMPHGAAADALSEAGSQVAGFAQFGYPGTSDKPVLMTVLGKEMTPRGPKVETTQVKTSAALGLTLTAMNGARQGQALVQRGVRAGTDALGGAANALRQGARTFGTAAGNALGAVRNAGSAVGRAAGTAAGSVANAARTGTRAVGRVTDRAVDAVDRAGTAVSRLENRGMDALNRGIGAVKNPRVREMLAKAEGSFLRSGAQRGQRAMNGMVEDAANFGTVRPGLVDLGISGADAVARVAKGDFAGAMEQLPTMMSAGYPLLTGRMGNPARFALDHEIMDGASGLFQSMRRPKTAALPVTPPGKSLPSVLNPSALQTTAPKKLAPAAPNPGGTQMPIKPIKVAQRQDGSWEVTRAGSSPIITQSYPEAMKTASSLSAALSSGDTVNAVLNYSRQAPDGSPGSSTVPRAADPNKPPGVMGEAYPTNEQDVQTYEGDKIASPLLLAQAARRAMPALGKLLPTLGRAARSVAQSTKAVGKTIGSKGLGLAGDVSTAMDVKSVAENATTGRQAVNAVDFKVTR